MFVLFLSGFKATMQRCIALAAKSEFSCIACIPTTCSNDNILVGNFELSNIQLISNKINLSGKDIDGPYCLPTCKYSGRDAAESIVRCYICMLWVHPVSSCGDSVDDSNHIGMYTIMFHLPQVVTSLSSIEIIVEKLLELNKHLIQMR